MPGHGKKQHEDILNKVRRLLPQCEEVHFCIADDNLMGHCVDKNKYGVSEKYPDLVFYTYDYKYPFIVEIGTYNPDKWDSPVIHIGFDLRVTNIGEMSGQAKKVSETIERLLTQRAAD